MCVCAILSRCLFAGTFWCVYAFVGTYLSLLRSTQPTARKTGGNGELCSCICKTSVLGGLCPVTKVFSCALANDTARRECPPPTQLQASKDGRQYIDANEHPTSNLHPTTQATMMSYAPVATTVVALPCAAAASCFNTTMSKKPGGSWLLP